MDKHLANINTLEYGQHTWLVLIANQEKVHSQRNKLPQQTAFSSTETFQSADINGHTSKIKSRKIRSSWFVGSLFGSWDLSKDSSSLFDRNHFHISALHKNWYFSMGNLVIFSQ